MSLDSAAVRQELLALRQTHANDNAALNKALVARLKALLTEGRSELQSELKADGNGRRCASALSRQMDSLIRCLFDFIGTVLYPLGAPSTSEHMAIVATGGYGRGLLAPRSDIDLLFLLPYKQTPWGESVVEQLLRVLWDLGLKVGHATRSVDQCLSLSRSDMTIRTALLDSRLITGSAPLFADLTRRFRAEVTHNTGRAFVDAKLTERNERHVKSGESRYKVEPNIKDGKGGIRDLHTLHWLLKYLHGLEPDKEAVAAGLFSDAEYRSFRRCEDFLWTVRCHLHFISNRPEERISFDVQPVLAERMRYGARGGLLAVERFMKHYFLVAREVGELTLAVCAALEAQQMKATPRLGSLLSAIGLPDLSWQDRRIIRRRTDFRIENNRLSIGAPEVFKQNPVNLLRIFKVAQEHDVAFHPDAVRLIRHSLRLITEKVRNDPEANQVFLEILTATTGVEKILRRMNETGVLGRFLPEFGACVAMMQFNMYHSYTVDEHLIMAVGLLSQIEAGTLGDDHPVATKIVHQVQNRRALYVAVLLHDVGKRLPGDHSLTGAAIARQLCPRMGLSKSETDLVAWLIEWHLVMSTFAQSRDISDPKTIRDFADIVQSPERLRLLLVLTVADIRAVGPGVWNGWKGQLLRNLYAETEFLLSGGHAEAGRKERVAAAQAALKAELQDWPPVDVDQVIARHLPAYWLTTNPARRVEHAKLLRKAEAEGKGFAYAVRTDSFLAMTELTVLAPDVPRLLAMMAGACAAAGADIMGAHVCTTIDGHALDTFQLRRDMDADSEERRGARIGEVIRKLIAGETTLDKVMERKARPQPRLKAFSIEPDVSISNSLSDRVTVLEVNGLDRPGLLYDVTGAISDLGLNIHSAHITTFGERAVDVFYVTGLDGKKITGSDRHADIRSMLLSVLSGTAAAAV